jgi:hypothetical protein
MADGTLKVGTITTSSGSGTITLGQSGETVTIPNTATVSGAMSNTPAFRAVNSANQTLSTTAWTKINFDTVEFSTGTYDTSNSRWTPGVAGKYLIHYHMLIGTMNDSNQNLGRIYLNGTGLNNYLFKNMLSAADSHFMMSFAFLTMTATDYIESYGWQNSGSNKDTNKDYGVFYAHRIIGA